MFYYFSPDFNIVNGALVFIVRPENVSGGNGGSYTVSVLPAPGGRRAVKGRKDPLGLDFFFTCTLLSYTKNSVCKHIGAVCIVHFS